MYEIKGNPVGLSPDLFTKALNSSDLESVLMLPTYGITQVCFQGPRWACLEPFLSYHPALIPTNTTPPALHLYAKTYEESFL